ASRAPPSRARAHARTRRRRRHAAGECAATTSARSRTRARCATASPGLRSVPNPSWNLSIRQAEDALGDDVELDLGRAALDRVAARAQPVARHLELVGLEARAFPADALRTADRDHELAPAHVELGAVVLEDRRLGPGLVA